MTFLLSAGNVSSGATDMLNELGVVWVEPEGLAELKQRGCKQLLCI